MAKKGSTGRGDVAARIAKRIGWHQRLHDPAYDDRNGSRWLPELRRWQAARLGRSFSRFLDDPARAPAARFFLSDIYGDRDFSRRDKDIVRVMPMMQRLLPASLLPTIADAIEVGALSHALDLRMAEALQVLAPRRKTLDEALYAQAWRAVGLKRLRGRQVALIARVGAGFGRALRLPGVSALLAFSRGPARLAGLSELQGFLERGYAAFDALRDADAFVAEIARDEGRAADNLFAGRADPFGFASG